MRHPLIALVGPSGSGKSTLIKAALEKFPTQLHPFMSLTTRPRRSAEDDLFYHLVTREDIKERETKKQLLQIAEYVGNIYGSDKKEINDLLERFCLIGAFVEPTIHDLLRAGYMIFAIKISPVDGGGFRDQTRHSADQKRQQIDIPIVAEIQNSFADGGWEQAQKEFLQVIKNIIERTS